MQMGKYNAQPSPRYVRKATTTATGPDRTLRNWKWKCLPRRRPTAYTKKLGRQSYGYGTACHGGYEAGTGDKEMII